MTNKNEIVYLPNEKYQHNSLKEYFIWKTEFTDCAVTNEKMIKKFQKPFFDDSNTIMLIKSCNKDEWQNICKKVADLENNHTKKVKKKINELNSKLNDRLYCCPTAIKELPCNNIKCEIADGFGNIFIFQFESVKDLDDFIKIKKIENCIFYTTLKEPEKIMEKITNNIQYNQYGKKNKIDNSKEKGINIFRNFKLWIWIKTIFKGNKDNKLKL